MKRTIASTVPLLILLIGAGHASAQRLPSRDAPDRVSPDVAKEQYQRAEQRAADLWRGLLKAKQDGHGAPVQELREKMRPLVEESFETRQRLQRAEVAALRRRLEDIEQAIENRERNKEALINARIEDWMNRTASPDVPIGPGNDPNSANKPNSPQKGPAPQSEATGDIVRLTPRQQEDAPDFDLETRERLAQLDLQAAEEDYLAAEKDLSQVRKLHETGAIAESELRAREKDHRHAAVELKRAKVKLEGLARQRTELQAKADDAINVAMAEESKAMARFNASRAEAETAQARVIAAEADVAQAEATYKYRETQQQRIKKLFEQKAVDEKLFDETAEQLETSKAGLDGAKAALAVAKATLNQSKQAIEERVAEAKGAQARVQAAKVERGRLGAKGQ